MCKYLTNRNMQQFISYFFVGEIAAVVEWVLFTFFLLENLLFINRLYTK